MNATTDIPNALDDLSLLLKAASDPLRLQVLRLLAQDSYGVSELCRIFGVRQSGMSHHLKILSQANLVTTRREGNSIFYRRALASGFNCAHLRNELFVEIDHLSVSDEVEDQLKVIRAERVSSSKEFFNQNSEKFRSQQDLIASYPVYCEQVSELIHKTKLPSQRLAIEIGPGEGEFLAILSQNFDAVVAVDNNQAMLNKAKVNSELQNLSNIEFILDDTSNIENFVDVNSVDLIVANMVFHHVPSPANLFSNLARILRPNGALVITDLCLHDQNWAREACGDIWLGFDPNDLSQWANNANLINGQSIYFALRNGFQIQIRQFEKNSNAPIAFSRK
ncbi:metalloregulator ArsR/SmtB family transcription factor [Sessilibacter sp. MAH1]